MLPTSSVELFAYPWDIMDRGVEPFVDECRGLGVDVIHVTTIYHSGKFFLPRNTSRRVYFPESGALYVPVADGVFGQGPVPAVSKIAGTGWLATLAKAAAKAGLRLAAWTVFHHSSALAARYPELTLRNVFGDPCPFALCPSAERVRGYSLALARALAQLEVFETLDLESIGYLGFDHGYHHEVTAVPAGPLERFLLSLCFCPACLDAGARAGIAMEPLRR